jgi:hypothetical protein
VTFPSGRHTSRPDDFCNSFLFYEMDDFDDKGSSYINHFLQPDTLIPDPSNPQAWNRYVYIMNPPGQFQGPDMAQIQSLQKCRDRFPMS